MGKESKPANSLRLHAFVEGLVQGVNFRYYTMVRARSLDLTGWVANRWDGKVETVAEGARDALEEFLAYLHQGPPSARVREVVAHWEQATHEFADFTVTRL